MLSSYEDIILNETGMHLEMLGPGDKEKLLEICRNIVTNGDVVSQIYSAFLYSAITDVSIMQSAILDHYVMSETEGLGYLQTVFRK